MDDKLIDNFMELERSLRVPVKISYDEVDRIVLNRLISIRNSNVNKNMNLDFIDQTIKWFLSEEEFQKYVIDGLEIKY
jgi:hypothetical protein